MSTYKDDPVCQRHISRTQWLIVEAAKITRELNQAELDYLRDGTPTDRVYRAELVERRSAYQLEVRELEIKLYDLKEAGRLNQRQDKYDTLVKVLNDSALGHLVKLASDSVMPAKTTPITQRNHHEPLYHLPPRPRHPRVAA